MSDNKTADVLQTLVDKLIETADRSALKPEQLEAILTRAGLSSAEAMRGKLSPENSMHPGKSAFSYPEGDAARPKPTLTRTTYFCGDREREDRLTPLEIELYNAITTNRDARRGTWTARIRQRGDHEELHIAVPAATVDQRMDLPSLILILHELNGGPSTEDVHVLVKQIEALKQLAVSKGASAHQLEATLLNA